MLCVPLSPFMLLFLPRSSPHHLICIRGMVAGGGGGEDPLVPFPHPSLVFVSDGDSPPTRSALLAAPRRPGFSGGLPGRTAWRCFCNWAREEPEQRPASASCGPPADRGGRDVSLQGERGKLAGEGWDFRVNRGRLRRACFISLRERRGERY